ncbi:hypothetical protein [Streptomyces violaceusniger]|uniref:Uncharacterized protein n=1 Tax=Streptomyces violaceusniger (strain Tu 4113) TaxID=653045 RepID=G2P7B3_STRV4|nr:hypothetical protein [Streptomyces violaceusniger]AEM87073.1 hypothetical protein Strvi_7738 [Streptomyces violaceusniger Tu 4113]
MTDTQTPAPAVTAEQSTNWPTAAFQLARVEICAGYQLAVVDTTPTAGHLDAALRHLRAAADSVGKEDTARILSALRAVNKELYRIARGVGHNTVI